MRRSGLKIKDHLGRVARRGQVFFGPDQTDIRGKILEFAQIGLRGAGPKKPQHVSRYSRPATGITASMPPSWLVF